MISVLIARSRLKKVLKWVLLGSLVLIMLFWGMIRVSSSYKRSSLIDRMRLIPVKDLQELDAFFRILILKEGGGYVLFGDKPSAFTMFFNFKQPKWGLRQILKQDQENKILKKGWETWKKYADAFPSKTFILACKQTAVGHSEIFLINKKRCEKVIDENYKDFRNILSSKIELERFFEGYIEGDQTLFSLLQEHHALLGLLLGFGPGNSWAFYRTIDLHLEDPYALNASLLQKRGFSSPKIGNLKSIFQEKNHRKCYKFLYLPFFLADLNSQETKSLQKKYRKQQEIVHQAYSTGHFLEVTLNQFSQ